MKKYSFPEQLVRLREDFLDYNRTKHSRGEGRITQLNKSINYLYEYLSKNGILDIASLNNGQIIEFQKYIYRNKHLSTLRSMQFLIQDLRLFYRYLYHKDLISKNPFENVIPIGADELGPVSITRYYSFEELITIWKNWMKRQEMHIETVKDRLDSLNLFRSFLEQKGIKSIYKVNPDVISEYKYFLKRYEYKPGLTYNAYTQTAHLSSICKFLLFLTRERIIKNNPSSHIELKKYYQSLKHECNKNTKIIPQRPIESRIPDPEIQGLFKKFIQYFHSRGGSIEHGKGFMLSIERFYTYMKETGISDLRTLTRRHLMDYQIWLYNQISIKGTRYAPNTLLGLLVDLRSFFRYLTKSEYLTSDPSASIDLPKEEQGIPHSCMTEREVQILLNQPDISSPIGLRDKAILEVLYSTAVRANELINLSTSDINFKDGFLRVEHPKGGKSFQRIVPIGKTACEYVNLYLDKVRPLIDNGNGGDWLFLSSTGNKLCRSYLSSMVRKYLFHTGLRKRITTHSFRVTCATHMLKNKADIRYVQEQLGHKSIRTTQGYTRLVPKDLKAVHNRCHPRERRINHAESQFI